MLVPTPNAATVTEAVMFAVICLIVLSVTALYFIGTLRKTLRKVPASMQAVSAEISWLLLIPGVSYIISWIMLPFTTPRAIRRALQQEGSQAWAKVQSMARVGLALCILLFFHLLVGYWIFNLSHKSFNSHDVAQHSLVAVAFFLLLLVAELIVFIIYWWQLIAVRSLLDQASRRHFNAANSSR